MNRDSINCFCSACTILLAMLVAGAPSAASAQSLEEVIENSLKAQGGRDALMGLKAVERKGDVSIDGSFGQMEGTVEEISIPWKKAYRSMSLDVFEQTDGFNGEIAWRDGMMGVEELEGEDAAQIKQIAQFHPLLTIGKDGRKAKKLDDETVDDVEYHVIEMTSEDGPPVKLFVDKKTNWITRTTLTQNNPQFGEVEITIELSDYTKFGDVMLPTKTFVKLGDLFEIETTFTETKVNGTIDEAIFEKPEQ